MKRLTILVALTLVLGEQSIRVLIPSLVLYLYSTLHVNVWVVVVAGYGTFALAFMTPFLVKWLTPRGTLRVAGAGLILCRVVEQISTVPTVDLVLAIGGTACFLWLLPLLFGWARADGDQGVRSFALGVLLGLSLDTTLRGLTGTLDLSWIPGPWPILTMIGLAGVFGYELWRLTRSEMTLSGEGPRISLILISLGLCLFIQALVFQNQGWVAQLTGWSPGAALSWIMVGNVGALFAASYAWQNPWLRSTPWWPLAPGGALTLALIFGAKSGWTFAVGALVGLLSSGLLLATVLGEIRESDSRAGIGRLSFSFGLGLLLFYILVTLYYVSFLVTVPIPRVVLAPAAGIGLTLCALLATRHLPLERSQQTFNWKSVRWSGLLMILPISILILETLWGREPITRTGDPVRVMTYNIHGAYGLNGRQDVEAIARVIESADTDVVVLQEIERGWLLEGSTDLLPLLSRRLHMPYTFMGTVTDPISGNAILSRYPILAAGKGELPNLDTLVSRGYCWAQIDLGAGESLWVITTHLHHEPERGDVRIAQVDAFLRAWTMQPQTILAGDMNAVLGSQEMQMLLEAGFVDSWAEAGHGDRPPIDWIFHTPDLIAHDVVKIENRASDHPAVVVTIERKEEP